MSGYLKDILLGLSMIAAPIILGTLLYYGLTISDRRHHEASDRKEDGKRQKSKPQSEQSDDAKTSA